MPGQRAQKPAARPLIRQRGIGGSTCVNFVTSANRFCRARDAAFGCWGFGMEGFYRFELPLEAIFIEWLIRFPGSLGRSPLDKQHPTAVARSFPLTLTLSLGESTCLARQPRIRQERGIYPARTPARQIRAWKFQDPVANQIFLRNKVRAPFARPANTLNTYLPRGEGESSAVFWPFPDGVGQAARAKHGLGA